MSAYAYPPGRPPGRAQALSGRDRSLAIAVSVAAGLVGSLATFFSWYTVTIHISAPAIGGDFSFQGSTTLMHAGGWRFLVPLAAITTCVLGIVLIANGGRGLAVAGRCASAATLILVAVSMFERNISWLSDQSDSRVGVTPAAWIALVLSVGAVVCAVLTRARPGSAAPQ